MDDRSLLSLSKEQIGDVLQKAGTSLMYLGKMNDSHWILHQAVDYNPHNVKAWMDLGRVMLLYNCGFAPALAVFKKSVGLDPNNVKVIPLIAGCLLHMGLSAEAKRIISKAVTDFPNHKQYLLNCAEQFNSFYRNWLHSNSTDTQLYQAIYVPSYISADDAGERSWGNRFFNSIVNSFVPTSSYTHLKTDDDTKSTGKQLHVVFMVDTEEERQRAFQTARQVATAALTKLGRIFYYKNVSLTLEYFSIALECDSQNVEAHCGRAKMYLHLKRDDPALQDITEGLQIDPTNSELLSLMETYEERFQKLQLLSNTVPTTCPQEESSLRSRFVSQNNNDATLYSQ